MPFVHKAINIVYDISVGISGFCLESRYPIPSTGRKHYMYDYKHNMTESEFKSYLKENNNFQYLDEFRFDVLDELISDCEKEDE